MERPRCLAWSGDMVEYITNNGLASSIIAGLVVTGAIAVIAYCWRKARGRSLIKKGRRAILVDGSGNGVPGHDLVHPESSTRAQHKSDSMGVVLIPHIWPMTLRVNIESKGRLVLQGVELDFSKAPDQRIEMLARDRD